MDQDPDVVSALPEFMNIDPLEVSTPKFHEGDWHPLRVTFRIKDECNDKMLKHMKGEGLREKLQAFHGWYSNETAVRGCKSWHCFDRVCPICGNVNCIWAARPVWRAMESLAKQCTCM